MFNLGHQTGLQCLSREIRIMDQIPWENCCNCCKCCLNLKPWPIKYWKWFLWEEISFSQSVSCPDCCGYFSFFLNIPLSWGSIWRKGFQGIAQLPVASHQRKSKAATVLKSDFLNSEVRLLIVEESNIFCSIFSPACEITSLICSHSPGGKLEHTGPQSHWNIMIGKHLWKLSWPILLFKQSSTIGCILTKT